MADVTDFNPVFGTRLDQLRAELDKEGIGYNLASGYRSPEYQGRMYANHQAKLAGQPLPYPNDEAPAVVAAPWRSFHNYGLAADFNLTNDADYARLQALAPQYGLSGIGMSDKGHIQLGGGSLADDIAKYKLANWRPASQPAPATGALAYSGPAGVLASQETGPESAGQGTPATASTGPLDVRQLVFNKLTGAGLQPHQAMGAIWSLNGESRGLNPNAYNPNDPGGSVGFGQWMGPRRAALEAFAKNRGTAVTDPNTQADFLVDELTNKDAATYQPGVFSAMQGAKTAEDATRVWTSKFERPEKDNSDARIKAGAQAASLDDKGNFVLGPGVGANAPSSTTTPATAPAVAAAPAADKPWWQKAFDAPVDAQGNPVAGGKSPFEQAATAFQGGDKGSSIEQFRKAQEEEAPQGTVRNQAGQAPGSRNTSPMGGALLPSVPQTYGQTLNSFSTPLTWNSAPPRAPQMPAAGLQGVPGAQIPGMTLTSFQAPQGIGYGVDPNIGYGYG